MVRRSTIPEQILKKVLAMNETQVVSFMATLSPDLLAHLDILLAKAEKDSTRLQSYLDK